MHDNCEKGHRCKQTHYSQEFKNNLAGRLNRIEGQVRGIKKMIVENIYCDDILNQITAIRAALASVQLKLLEGHIKSCVIEQLANGKMEVIEELNKTIKKILK